MGVPRTEINNYRLLFRLIVKSAGVGITGQAGASSTTLGYRMRNVHNGTTSAVRNNSVTAGTFTELLGVGDGWYVCKVSSADVGGSLPSNPEDHSAFVLLDYTSGTDWEITPRLIQVFQEPDWNSSLLGEGFNTTTDSLQGIKEAMEAVV